MEGREEDAVGVQSDLRDFWYFIVRWAVSKSVDRSTIIINDDVLTTVRVNCF